MGLVALPERDAFAARRATIATALLLLFTDCGFAAIERAVHGDIHWMYLAHATLGALIALLLWRSRMPARAGAWCVPRAGAAHAAHRLGDRRQSPHQRGSVAAVPRGRSWSCSG